MRSRFRSALLLSVLLAACDSTEPPGPPAGLVGVGGTAFALIVATPAADSLGVKVVDADGRAVANAAVAWTVDGAAGVANVSPASSVTNRQGIARAALRAGTVAGPATVRATATGTELSLPYAVTVNPGPTAQLLASGSGTLGIGVTRTVITGQDQYGNATLAGVTFTSSNTAVAEVSGTGAVTSRALGTALVTARAGAVSAEARVWVVPAAIQSCESNTATLCSTWTLADSLYTATWDQGSQAVIHVGHFSADSVRFHRVDPAGTSAGMTAVYRGSVANRAVGNGLVVWTQRGSSFGGTWTAAW